MSLKSYSTIKKTSTTYNMQLLFNKINKEEANNMKKKIMDNFNKLSNMYINKRFIKENSYYYDIMSRTASILYGFSNIINSKTYILFNNLNSNLIRLEKIKNKNRRLKVFIDWCKEYIEISIQYTGFNLYIEYTPEKDVNIEDYVQSLNSYGNIIHMIKISSSSYLAYMNHNNNKVQTLVKYVNNNIKKSDNKKVFTCDYLKLENKIVEKLIYNIEYIESKINVIDNTFDWKLKKNNLTYLNPHFKGFIIIK